MADVMSASPSQLSASRLSPSKIRSQTYKKASQLYLTRRLQEALATLEPVITPRAQDEQYTDGEDSGSLIATASSTWRIKVWNLYITVLSAIVDLGAEEGSKELGQKEWKAISGQVRDGSIWETVVQTGYKGLEGSVDAEVVYNLATLLLNHSPSQTTNQQRLETYLSSFGQPHLDIAEHLRNSPPGSRRQQMRPTGGTDTPKDLNSRVKIIELFTLHVLPRNEEWEYAREFINLSEVLDEERKEMFLQTLDGLKEEKEQGELRAAALQREKDAELERQSRDAERRRAEEAAAAERAQQNEHKRNGSEVDYGVEKSRRNGTPKGRGSKSADRQSGKAGGSSGRATSSSLTGSSSKSVKKPEKPESRPGQTRALANILRNLFQYISQTITGNPMSLARAVLFMLGIIMRSADRTCANGFGGSPGRDGRRSRGRLGWG
ncbi:Peroxin 26 [Aspergillus sp. HF37]|nr:Peroxin 26 [Aspergillus sp. HF37]